MRKITVIWQLALLAWLVASPTKVGAFEVSFGNGGFFDPYRFFERLGEHPHAKALEQAIDGVVLIGGRASGVIISPDGLMMTAKHTLEGLSFTNEDCSRIPLFLFHERHSDDSMDTRLQRLTCDRVLVNDYADDFVLLKLKNPNNTPFPFAPPEADVAGIQAGMRAFAVGHPHALDYAKGVKKVSVGQIVLYAPNDEQLPHFLHRIDTEGGSSGGAIISEQGKLLGIHFRGVRSFGPGVKVLLDGREQLIHSFNIALPVPYLLKKYLH